MKDIRIAAIVLAGGQDDLAQEEKVAAKSLIVINNKPMASYVLEPLNDLPEVKYVVFVGPEKDSLQPLYDTRVSAAETLTGSLRAGLAASEGCDADYYLVLTADLPWITQEALASFLQGALALNADLVYLATDKASAEAQFPSLKRTYGRFFEGKLTGGNVLLLKAGAESKLLPFIDKAFAARKNPFRLASIIGFETLFALLLGRLKVVTLERRVSSLLGFSVAVFLSADASLATDVDSAEHLREARKLGSS